MSSSNCSVDKKCQICTNWSQDTWYKVIFRRRFADKMPAKKKVKDKNAKLPRHSPSPSGVLSEEDKSMAEKGSLGDEAINDALTPDGRVESRENKPDPRNVMFRLKIDCFLFKWNLMD